MNRLLFYSVNNKEINSIVAINTEPWLRLKEWYHYWGQIRII